MAQKIRIIRIEKIEPNYRCICEIEALEELAKSIRQDGQKEPMEVWFTGRCFRIVDGEKRWRACKKLGIRRVRAIIVEADE